MKKKSTQPKDLAAIHALGALDGDDLRAFTSLLAESAAACTEADAYATVAETLAQASALRPPSQLKERILQRVALARARAQAEQALKGLVPASAEGLSFLPQAGGPGWLPLRVPGASVKLLSYDQTTDYAVVLGKLEAGARYPSHTHKRAEDIFMLSGDLHIGEHLIQAGDFHHAEAGSKHGVNWSETGCVLLAVLSKEDLLAQLVP